MKLSWANHIKVLIFLSNHCHNYCIENMTYLIKQIFAFFDPFANFSSLLASLRVECLSILWVLEFEIGLLDKH